MGNQSSHGPHAASTTSGAAAAGVTLEPLEAFSKEKQRDDHLKNLGFKRSKSLRKSIAKRLKRKKKPESVDDFDLRDGASKASKTSRTSKESELSLETRVELVERPAVTEKHERPLVGQPQPLPASVQDLSSFEGSRPRTMDRLRQSLRASMKRRKDKGHSLDPPIQSIIGDFLPDNSKPNQFQIDDAAVRSGICNFQVKYLGCVEVFNSRGMEVCEEAVKALKNSKRKSIRSVLYVSGDGLRVVDDETRGLILDQTIEKVSFCAPDRNYDRGFSYICRDGTTRRWMCHGFMAIKDSGERLSHAVGCAFAICLERKQRRDSECKVSVTFDSENASFTRTGSFRQATITERLQDPQVLKPSQPPPPPQEGEDNPFAIARPHATDFMLQRQTSFRGFGHLQASGNSPFKRQLSLRLSELPSTLERQRTSGLSIASLDPISLDPLENAMSPPLKSLDIVEEESEIPELEMCQKLASELSVRSSSHGNLVNGNYKIQEPLKPSISPRTGLGPSPLPPVPENLPLSNVPIHPIQVTKATIQPTPSETQTSLSKASSNLDAFLSTVKPMEYDNPWDWVPDQPLKAGFAAPNKNSSNACDTSSSGISSGSLASIGGSAKLTDVLASVKTDNGSSKPNDTTGPGQLFSQNSYFEPGSFSLLANHTNGTESGTFHEDLDVTAGILEDPFDAEWAALAMRNATSKNPFLSDKNEGGLKKAFELQM